MFAKRVHKLKQSTNLRHDENYAFFDVSLLVNKMGGGRGREGEGEGGTYFKFQLIGGALIRRGRLFKGEGGTNSVAHQ